MLSTLFTPKPPCRTKRIWHWPETCPSQVAWPRWEEGICGSAQTYHVVYGKYAGAQRQPCKETHPCLTESISGSGTCDTKILLPSFKKQRVLNTKCSYQSFSMIRPLYNKNTTLFECRRHDSNTIVFLYVVLYQSTNCQHVLFVAVPSTPIAWMKPIWETWYFTSILSHLHNIWFAPLNTFPVHCRKVLFFIHT